MSLPTTIATSLTGLVVALLLACTPAARAQQAETVNITVKNNRFEPAEIPVPANRPIVIRIKNLDSKAMEFESVSLRVEKVVPANGEGVVNVRALQPGRYEFFDDFRKQTRGALVVKVTLNRCWPP